nr:helix-turn-helix domain-containing protein [uncultured Oscillibacter sp.]
MTYTNEEKMNIINHINQGASIKDLCAEYGVSRSTLYRWASNYSKPDSDSEKEHIPTVKDYNMLQ